MVLLRIFVGITAGLSLLFAAISGVQTLVTDADIAKKVGMFMAGGLLGLCGLFGLLAITMVRSRGLRISAITFNSIMLVVYGCVVAAAMFAPAAIGRGDPVADEIVMAILAIVALMYLGTIGALARIGTLVSLRDDPNFPRSALGTVILVLCSMPLLAAASLVQRGSAELALDRLMASKATLEEAVAMDADSEVPRRLLDIVNARLGKGDTSAVRTPIDPVPLPDSIRPVLDGPTPDSGAFIQLRATAIRFLPESQWRRTAYYQAKVLDRSGVDALSSFQFSFDPLAERLYVNSLEVLDESGAIVHTGELSSYYIADSSDEEFASQDRAPYARRGAGAGQDDSVHGHA